MLMHVQNIIYFVFSGRQLTVFNSQSQIQLGGRWNPTLNRVERPFRGIMAGLVFNELRPLDLAADNDPRTKIVGAVRILESIPFDYRERYPRLFEPGGGGVRGGRGGRRKGDRRGSMQRTNPSKRPEPGVNDDLIYGAKRCSGDEDLYYDPKCFSFDGSGMKTI